MSKIGIFYGSTTGNTESIARRIATQLNVAGGSIHDAADITDALLSQYDVLVLGSSTWGAGELQDDWYDTLAAMKKMSLTGKKVALFGCGDSASYSDTFCDAIGLIYEELKETGCTFVGATETAGYTYDDSAAVVDGLFVGLPIDEDNEGNLTAERVDKWVALLKEQIG